MSRYGVPSRSGPDIVRDMSNTHHNPHHTNRCEINETHCELCGRPVDPFMCEDGYTQCCNELIGYPGECRNHHGEAEAEYEPFEAKVVAPTSRTHLKQNAALALRNDGWTFKAIAERVGYASPQSARSACIAAAKR